MRINEEILMNRKIAAILMLCCQVSLLLSTVRGEELLPVQIQGKYGYVNSRMQVVIPAKWDSASYFRDCKVAKVGIEQPNGNCIFGLINKEGEYLVPCKYQIWEGEGGAFFGEENGYYLILDPINMQAGYYDIQNNYFCEPKYDDVDIRHRNEKNIISVGRSEDEGRTYINAITGERIGYNDYLETFPWHDNAALGFTLNGEWCVQYLDGSRKVIPEEYDVRSDIYHEMFIVMNRNNQFSLMNVETDIVADWYDWIEVTSLGVFEGTKSQYSGIVYCIVN